MSGFSSTFSCGTRSGGRGSANGNSSAPVTTGTLYRAGLNLSWTPDLWGRVARQQEDALAEADASAAQRDASRLALQLEAAQGYVRERALDQQMALNARALTAYERSLQLTLLDVQALRLQASMQLVAALGGRVGGCGVRLAAQVQVGREDVNRSSGLRTAMPPMRITCV